jgi:tetratricopeptide (TPR) repeat protein
MLDQDLHGLSAAGTHLGNLLLHAVNTCLLFLALSRLTGHTGRSAVCAALFGLHPLNVESVAWATERKGLLAGSFFAGALWVHAGVGGRALRAALETLLLALGLMAKSVLVTLPMVLLLLDYWPLRRMTNREGRLDARRVFACLSEKLPQLVLLIAASIVTLNTQALAGATRGIDLLPLGERLANAVFSYARYLGKLVWPTDLAVFYPHPRSDLPSFVVAASALLLAAVTALAVRARREHGQLLTGWLWFVGMLVPTIGIVQVGGQALADRYAYLPCVGLLLALVWTAAERLQARPRLAVALSMTLLLLLGAQSRRQLAHWHDSESLFRHALAVTERNHVAHTQLAHALIVKGDRDEAVPHLRSALSFDRDNIDALNNLAWLLATDPAASPAATAEGLELARRVVSLAPDDPSLLDTLAIAEARVGNFERALVIANRALVQARVRGDTKLGALLERRLELFRARRPLLE